MSQENSDEGPTDINKVRVKHLKINSLQSKSKPSYCWKHFGNLLFERDGKRKLLSPDQVYCIPCLKNAQEVDPDSCYGRVKIKTYGIKVSTGNLIRHLKDDHSLYEEKTSQSTNQNLHTFFNVSRPTPSTSTSTTTTARSQKKWILARDLALWFCRSLLPFDTVSDEGMIDFLRKYNVVANKDELPVRTTISREALSDVYESVLGHVKMVLLSKMSTHAAFTTDLWQDVYRHKNYITVTLHFISDDVTNVQSYTLATRVFTEKKTGEALTVFIENLRNSFGLSNKSLHLVTDSGSNVKRIAPLMSMTTSHLCLGHGLHNLVVVDGIKKTQEIHDIVTQCKKVVKKLRYRLPELEEEADKEQRRLLNAIDEISTHIEEDEQFPIGEPDNEAMQEEEPGPSTSSGKTTNPPSIKSATPTRWNSTLDMLRSISSSYNKQPINNLLGKYNMAALKFQETQWELIEDLIKFLQTIKDAVEFLSAQETCSINLALLFRSEIKEALMSISDDEKLIMRRLKRNMLDMLDHRFPITKLTVAAALLDPRFAKIRDIDEYLENIAETRVSFLNAFIYEVLPATAIESALNKSERDRPGPSSENKTAAYLLKLAQKHTGEFTEQQESIEKECWKYLASCDACDVADGNIIKYWHDRRLAFPILYLFAKSILCVPATSTPSERVFSIAGLTLTAKRSRLNSTRVDKIIFIHDNYKHCKKNFDKV